MFGDQPDYAAEAEERWGGTEAYRESMRRTSAYTDADWKAIGDESARINAAFMALMAASILPESTEAMEIAARHRDHITRWFYDCTPEIHAGLADMYVTDPRFTAGIDGAGEGLAGYMSAAIKANATRDR